MENQIKRKVAQVWEPTAGEVKQVYRDFAELKKRYTEEMDRWTLYDKSMKEWKNQVVAIVQNLKTENAAKKEELLKAQEEVQLKNQEVADLRHRLDLESLRHHSLLKKLFG
jgi:pyruvate-formate lyase